jgi:hypothetical protein
MVVWKYSLRDNEEMGRVTI